MYTRNIFASCVTLFAVFGAGIAFADSITAPSSFPGGPGWSYANWDYGCQIEYNCGTDQTFGPVAANYLYGTVTPQATGYLTATIPAAGASFSYQEVDDLSGNPVDFVAFNNGYATGPVTFTFADPSNHTSVTAAGFVVTLYSNSSFNATATAYDVNGNLLGSTDVASTQNNNETYLQIFGPPTFTAIVGVLDFVNNQQASNIASVVVSTDGASANWFGFGTVAVQNTPAPAPALTSVTPSSGPAAGGNAITIAGTGFTGATGVTIGGAAATNIVVVSDTSITATAPPGAPGSASVVITTPNGSNAPNTLYTYVPAQSSQPQLPPLQVFDFGPVGLQVVSNESLVASASVNILANQVGPSWQATTTTPWLTLTHTQGSFPGGLSIAANATGMAAGTYHGSITVTSRDPVSGASVVDTSSVALTVLPPAPLTASPASLPSAFGYPVGSATGYDIQIGPAGLAFTASTSADSASWLSISPTSGVAPATIHVVVDPSKATYGVYQDSIVIISPGAPDSPVAVPVRMVISSFVPLLPQEVNSATGAGPDHTVAPNELASLFLSDFSCSTQPVVTFDGATVAWSTYSAGQINYAVPATVKSASTLSVSCNGATAWSFSGLLPAATIPGIFTVNGTGAGQAAAVNADGSVNGAANAATRASMISIYVTGFGAFSPARLIAGTVTAQVGGMAATVQYAGPAGGNTDALQRVDLIVPAGSPAGTAVPVVLRVDGTPTQLTATLALK